MHQWTLKQPKKNIYKIASGTLDHTNNHIQAIRQIKIDVCFVARRISLYLHVKFGVRPGIKATPKGGNTQQQKKKKR